MKHNIFVIALKNVITYSNIVKISSCTPLYSPFVSYYFPTSRYNYDNYIMLINDITHAP